jgi:membrane-bound ClpP family serine protease
VIFLVLLSILLGFRFYVFFASRRHKLYPPSERLNSSTAIVEKQLSPDGAVIVNGELWPARSNNYTFISSRSVVKVVGSTGHTLLIEEIDR